MFQLCYQPQQHNLPPTVSGHDNAQQPRDGPDPWTVHDDDAELLLPDGNPLHAIVSTSSLVPENVCFYQLEWFPR